MTYLDPLKLTLSAKCSTSPRELCAIAAGILLDKEQVQHNYYTIYRCIDLNVNSDSYV